VNIQPGWYEINDQALANHASPRKEKFRLYFRGGDDTLVFA